MAAEDDLDVLAGEYVLGTLAPEERDELRTGVSGFVGREWTWERTATRILAAGS